jgi:SAM-dependent methyltransferase
MDSYNIYFSGKQLYGDDFTIDQIRDWYIAEEEGYAHLIKDKKHNINEAYIYQYNSMNTRFGFNYLKKDSYYSNVLGFGSAYGHEFFPIIEKIKKITIVEPSDILVSKHLMHLKPLYIKPDMSGKLPFIDNSFDLITCFSVLHHIPNVTYVLGELIRVLKPEGVMMIREPIRTMGDWRNARNGLTKNERGIPHKYFDILLKQKPIKIIKKSFCDSNFAFQIISKILPVNRDSMLYQEIDRIVSFLFSWNIHYHTRNVFQKMAPASIFYVIKKL